MEPTTRIQHKRLTSDAGEVIDYHIGTGNVFADMELPDADELYFKCRLLQRIAEIPPGDPGTPHAPDARLFGQRHEWDGISVVADQSVVGGV